MFNLQVESLSIKTRFMGRRSKSFFRVAAFIILLIELLTDGMLLIGDGMYELGLTSTKEISSVVLKLMLVGRRISYGYQSFVAKMVRQVRRRNAANR